MNSTPNGFLLKLAVEYIIAYMFLDNNLQGSSHLLKQVGFRLQQPKGFLFMNDDTISRKAAIDILDAYQVMVENGEENPYAWARLRMSELPPAQPAPCEFCKHNNIADDKACLQKGEPMRLIDADALQEKLTKKKPGPANARYTEGFNDALLRFKSMIHAAPTIEPERKKGKWQITDAYPHNVYCSECHTRFAQTHWAVWEDGSLPRNFCPNCGADMREEDS